MKKRDKIIAVLLAGMLPVSSVFAFDKVKGGDTNLQINEQYAEETEVYSYNYNQVFVTVGAGVKMGNLAQILLKEEIEGFEFAAGIPGTIGGAIRMNAGAYGKEMKDIVLETTYIDMDGNIYTISNNEQKFEYRKSIFSNDKFIILSTKLILNYGIREKIKEKMSQYARK